MGIPVPVGAVPSFPHTHTHSLLAGWMLNAAPRPCQGAWLMVPRAVYRGKAPGATHYPSSPVSRKEATGRRVGRSSVPPCCAPGCPQHRSQAQAVHRRADFPFPTPLPTPGKTCSLDRHCIVYSSNMLHLESCPGAEPRTSDTASLYFPCPNLHDPSCILLPLNPSSPVTSSPRYL